MTAEVDAPRLTLERLLAGQSSEAAQEDRLAAQQAAVDAADDLQAARRAVRSPAHLLQ